LLRSGGVPSCGLDDREGLEAEMSNEASVAVSEEFAGRLGNMVNGGRLR